MSRVAATTARTTTRAPSRATGLDLGACASTLAGSRAKPGDGTLGETLRRLARITDWITAMRMTEKQARRLTGARPRAKKPAKKIPRGPSKLERQFASQLILLCLPIPEREYRFHATRRWRFDFAWPDLMLAVEIEGGTWTEGRHVRPKGFQADCEKYNEAALGGWRVLRMTEGMVASWVAAQTAQRAIDEADSGEGFFGGGTNKS